MHIISLYFILLCLILMHSLFYPTCQGLSRPHFQLCGAGLERNRTKKAKRNTPIRVMTSCHENHRNRNRPKLGAPGLGCIHWVYMGEAFGHSKKMQKTFELVLRLVTVARTKESLAGKSQHLVLPEN